MTVITPTVGRVVWYRRDPTDDQPHMATVCYVWNDRMVNLAGFDHNGNPYKATSVTLRQEGDAQPLYPHAEWMPYQVGQAKKHEKKDEWKNEAELLGLVVHHDEPHERPDADASGSIAPRLCLTS